MGGSGECEIEKGDVRGSGVRRVSSALTSCSRRSPLALALATPYRHLNTAPVLPRSSENAPMAIAESVRVTASVMTSPMIRPA